MSFILDGNNVAKWMFKEEKKLIKNQNGKT
jgi:hypothetical protein